MKGNYAMDFNKQNYERIKTKGLKITKGKIQIQERKYIKEITRKKNS